MNVEVVQSLTMALFLQVVRLRLVLRVGVADSPKYSKPGKCLT